VVYQVIVGLCAVALLVSSLGLRAGPALAAAAAATPPAPTMAPTIVAPSGNTGASTPTFTWHAVQGTTTYRLRLNTSGGANLLENPIYPAMACAGSTCSTRAGTLLGPGTYNWRLQPSNGAGAGPWSTPMFFAIPGSASAPSR
jgi:hypothetical protein